MLRTLLSYVRYVLVMIYRQCKADLFFIDWEPTPTKPKGEAHTATKNQVCICKTHYIVAYFVRMYVICGGL